MKSAVNTEAKKNSGNSKPKKEKKEVSILNDTNIQKRKGKVVSISKYSVIVQDDNGSCFTIFDNLDVKNGDIIEF